MNASTPTEEQDARRLEAASNWVQRLRSEPQSEALLAEWLQWCADPLNQDAFEKVHAVWQGIGAPELQPLVKRARNSQAAMFGRGTREPRLRWLIGLAAALALFLLPVLWWAHTPDTLVPLVSFTTALGQNRAERMPDGSRIELGAQSDVDAQYTQARREINVLGGEAFFIVAKDPGRPFVVTAGTVRVTAVGTEFNVLRSSADTVVTVTEGRVNVSSAEALAKSGGETPEFTVIQVSAGEQVRYSIAAQSLTVVHVDPQLASSWRQGVLTFVDQPLGSVVSYVNRYSTRKVVIVNPDLARRSYTGTVYDGKIGEWLLGLERIYPLRVVDKGAGEVMLAPIPPDSKSRQAAGN